MGADQQQQERANGRKVKTHSLQEPETRAGTVYLQSMIMVRVSLSLASWNGGWPQTSMKRITPRLQMSEAEREMIRFTGEQQQG